jgi:GTP-binding protein HflX
MLVAAFRATLEDVISADVILHVRDVSHGDTEAQAADVASILRDLGVDPDDHTRLIEVWNKADLLPEDERVKLAGVAEHRAAADRPVLVSAITGEGIEALLALVERRVARASLVYSVALGPADGSLMNWLYEDAEVLERRMTEDGSYRIAVRVLPEKETRLLRRFPDARLIRKEGA